MMSDEKESTDMDVEVRWSSLTAPQAMTREDLLTICPKEVWTSILEEYIPKRDLLNCSRTCTLFDDILKKEKTNWLFDLVFPHIFPYLRGKEILGCRNVSKTWCRAVDTYLENFESRVPFNEEHVDLSSTQRYNDLAEKKISAVKFETTAKFKKFMKEMSTTKNPYVGRSIWVADEEPPATAYLGEFSFGNRNRTREERERAVAAEKKRQEDFWNLNFEMLTLYGEHISHFTLGNSYGPGTGLGTKRFYDVIRRSLERLPNLKSLHLYGICNYFDDIIHDGLSEKTKERIFREFLHQNPLPDVPTLETLEMTYTFGFPHPLQEKLLLINPSGLKRLEIDLSELARSYSDGKPPPMKLIPGMLSDLRDLNIKIGCVEHLQQFLEFVSTDAKLGRIFLNFDCDNQQINYDLLCDILNPYTKSLRMVGMMSHDPMDDDEDDFNYLSIQRNPGRCSLLRLNAPVLSSLELDGIEFQSDFLSPDIVSNLEYLHVRRFFRNDEKDNDDTCEPPTEKKSKVEKDFYDYVFDDEIHNSSIWREMKKLRMIKAETCSSERHVYRVCTRQMHEYYGSKNLNYNDD